MFILHILIPGIFRTVAAAIMYIDHLLKHISKKSPLRKPRHIFPGGISRMLTNSPVNCIDCYYMLAFSFSCLLLCGFFTMHY